eukprot:CAMPEP_0202689728 /NCGR_PEP_ID=MMETSP1385-20130828/4926_1 /ASSEMBLY_ACC=CAM_ASM_000861 /TAXON_ID=933848 /ORGANISM="Elphidium margaritaceum" /LENGTH=507 /DNA_ID=CAMNT_0049344907 /DNA_START=40 /DNA_END=1563 /DNA_ORIENTATION=+
MMTVWLIVFNVCAYCSWSLPFKRIFVELSHSTEKFPGVVSDYSKDALSESFEGNIVSHASDPKGCSEWPSGSISQSKSINIGMVERGVCTFFDKTKFAQRAGLNVLMVVSNDESLEPMGVDEEALKAWNQEAILTFMVPLSFRSFMNENTDASTSMQIRVTEYKSTIYDSGMIVMVLVATLLVFLGAYYSSDTEREMYDAANSGSSYKSLRRTVPVQVINNQMAWSFVVVASTGLLVLYFFVSKIFIVIVLVFCMSATNGLSNIFTHFIDRVWPDLQHHPFIDIPAFELNLTVSDFLGLIPACIISLTWFWIRTTATFAWMLQNVMCVGLLLVLQRTVRLTDIKTASILLSTAFLYDIFWVFISPMFFQSSVMVAVATYNHGDSANDTLPVVLKFPRIDDIFHHHMILGLGDIALPGLLVSFLLRYDYVNKTGMSITKGYFVPALIGYAVGMMLTDINLVLMQHGQPALLFLVPCTLGTTYVLAYKRGHLNSMLYGINKSSTTTNSI